MAAGTNKIFCVDDDPLVLATYRMLHGQRWQSDEPFHIETADNAEQGLQILTERGPFAVIVADMVMPGMDGVQFLRRVQAVAPTSVRMMLTGHAALQIAMDAVNEGHIFRFLTKPFTLTSLTQALHAGVQQYQLVTAEKELLEQTLASSMKVLTDVLSLVNPAAFGRAVRVQRLVKRLAEALGVKNAWQLEVAATLSQMGCVTLPEDILGKIHLGLDLLPDEAALFAAHPKVGHDLIAPIPRLETVAQIIAYQEKCFDGSGVPANDKHGEDIPLGARVLKIALDFDSFESQGLAGGRALARMRQYHGRYDPAILEALSRIVAADAQIETKELSLRDLMVLLQSAEQQEVAVSNGREPLAPMILAEDVLSSSGVLLLSKGQKITVALLQRLRNFTSRSAICEPIRVWMPDSDKSGIASHLPSSVAPINTFSALQTMGST